MAMKIYTEVGGVAAEMKSIRRVGENLVISGKLLGTMNTRMYIRPEEIWNGLRLLFTRAVISYILLLPYFLLKRAYFKVIKGNGQGIF